MTKNKTADVNGRTSNLKINGIDNKTIPETIKKSMRKDLLMFFSITCHQNQIHYPNLTVV